MAGDTLPAQSVPPKDEAKLQSPNGDSVHWEGLEQTDEFRQLVAARLRFVLPATVFFLAYYFALPLSNGLFPNVMRTEIIGHINLAYLFALSEFIVAWLLAYFYIRQAGRVFDPLAEKVRQRAARGR
jgi:uncharacterized membrane protein (DUF485 family)